MLKAVFLIALAGLGLANASPTPAQIAFASTSGTDAKVNVTLYVMSRCPDARLCEGVFEDVFKVKGMTSKVDLNLGYIAQSNSSAPLGLQCKHGLQECLGNAHQLCLHHHLSLTDFYAVLTCMNYQSPFPGDIGQISLAKRCTKAVGVDWEESGVGKCIEGKEGKREGLAKEGYELLKDNVEVTQATNITTSCTIRINGRGCKVDDGVWTGCDDGHAASDFARVIEEEWKKLQK